MTLWRHLSVTLVPWPALRTWWNYDATYRLHWWRDQTPRTWCSNLWLHWCCDQTSRPDDNMKLLFDYIGAMTNAFKTCRLHWEQSPQIWWKYEATTITSLLQPKTIDLMHSSPRIFYQDDNTKTVTRENRKIMPKLFHFTRKAEYCDTWMYCCIFFHESDEIKENSHQHQIIFDDWTTTTELFQWLTSVPGL